VSTPAPDGSANDLSRRALSLEVSATVAVAQRASALRAEGHTVLDFSVGEPDQPTPRHISEAAMAALENGRTRYTSAAGIHELRAAVAQRYKKDYKVAFADSEVAITCGGKQALYLACQALFDRGDEVIIPSPHWPTFGEAVRLAGARPILVHTSEKDGFKVTARTISKATGPRTKAVLLNTPNNPTGAVIDPDDLLVIGDMAQRRKFTILYDDTYARMVFGKAEPPVLHQLKDAVGDRFVVLGTASKSYCMTGWRIGWVLGPKKLVDACAALVSHSTQCPTAFAQFGAVEALAGPQRFVQDLVTEYRRRRDFIHEALTAIPRITCVQPAGAFYAFPNVARYLGPGRPTSIDLARRLLDEHKVAVVPGEAFAAPATSESRSRVRWTSSRKAWTGWPRSWEPSRDPHGRLRADAGHAHRALPAHAQGEGLGAAGVADAGRRDPARPGPRHVRRVDAPGGAGRRAAHRPVHDLLSHEPAGAAGARRRAGDAAQLFGALPSRGGEERVRGAGRRGRRGARGRSPPATWD
jgi:aspartate aminotransferase